MVLLKVRRLYLEGSESIEARIVDRVCRRSLEILRNQNLRAVTDYRQKLQKADKFSVHRRDQWFIDGDRLIEYYENDGGPFLFFTPRGVNLFAETKYRAIKSVIRGYGGNGVAVIYSDIVTSVTRGASYILHEAFGHAYYDLPDHYKRETLCAMSKHRERALLYCNPCLEKARAVE